MPFLTNKTHSNDSIAFDQSSWLQRIAKWLSRRDYTEAELRTKLEQAGLEVEQQSALIERAQSLGWLEDERVAATTVARKSTQWGKRRLVQHLQERGIHTAAISQATAEIDASSELEAAFTLWLRKFRGAIPVTPQDMQKHIRFLATRGYSMHTIRNVFIRAKESPPDSSST